MSNYVIDLKDIKFGSINNRYNRNFSLTKEYRNFRKMLVLVCDKKKLKPPYFVSINIWCYQDIDASIKVILDALEIAGTIKNDRDIIILFVKKYPIKKGKKGSLKVYVEGNYNE